MYNHQLDTFIAVAETGSFSKAGASLFISPTAVIQQMNLLEATCGVKLLERTHRGCSLTPAGEAMLEEARSIVATCDAALRRVRSLASESERTVRIATALLFKCRLLPRLCKEVAKRDSDLKFELPSVSDRLTRDNDFSGLGKRFDVFEGIYCDISWDGLCRFLELTRVPMACGVSRTHELSTRVSLALDDLAGQTVVMPIAGVSRELDAFRADLLARVPSIEIVDSPYFGLDTFTQCEMMQYVLITQPVYADIHTGLVTIPLESGTTLPYGLVYPRDPDPAVERFIRLVEEMVRERPELAALA